MSGPPTPEAAPSAGRASAFSTAAEWLGDRLNPILVKETRQALKSKQFTLWFVLLLAGGWVATIGAIAYIGPSIYYLSAGSQVLFVYYVVLALPLVVVTPFSAYRSLSSEHEDNTRDLLEVSSLTPRQVIHGKLGSAALQVVIFLSAIAPCLAFTYLLRGVSITQIVLLLAYAVLASLGLSMVGIVLAAVAKQRHVQVFLSILLVGGLFYAFYQLLELAEWVLALNSPQIASDDFWYDNAAGLSLYATTFGVAYAAAVALTTFTSANRSTGLRVAMFVQQAVYVAWIAGEVSAGLQSSTLFRAFTVAAVYWLVAGAAMTSEDPTLSLRVRRSLPQSLLGRALWSWFNPGSGSGYVFAVTNLLTLAVLTCLTHLFGGLPALAVGEETAIKGVFLLTAYVIAYMGLGRLAIIGLRRVSEVSGVGGFLIQVLFVLGGTGLPYVVSTLFNWVRVNDLFIVSLPSPVWVVNGVLIGRLDPAVEVGLLVAVGSAAGVLGLINLALAGREARLLRVAAPKRVIQDDEELSPKPEPQATNPWGDLPEAAAESP